MSSQDNIQEAIALIKKASSITLLTHKKPDGDGMSACAAMDILLRRMGKTVEAIYPDRPEFEFKRQPENVLIGEHRLMPDLLIAFDTANYERLYFPSEFEGIPLINIDHHLSNSIDGNINIIDAGAASACEVFYNILSEWDERLIDRPVAEALLFGVLYDSRVFHTQAVSASTLRIAADLIDRGADLFKLKVELLANKDPKIIKLWACLLERIEISTGGRAAWSYITQDDLKAFGLTLYSVVGFSNFLTDLSHVDITMLFYETEEGKTKVSLRSKIADVNALAAQFGGGGHKHASGMLSDKDLHEFMAEVVAAVR